MATTKTASSIDKRQALSLLEGFFKTFKNCCNQKTGLNASVLEPFLSENFHLTSNGRVETRNLKDYLKRLAHFQTKFTHLEITGPTSEPLIEGNRIAFPYTIDCTTKSGQKHEVFIIGIGTVEDNKLKSWTQVTHEKGTSVQWDS